MTEDRDDPPRGGDLEEKLDGGATPPQVFGPQMHACSIFTESPICTMTSGYYEPDCKQSLESLGCQTLWYAKDKAWREAFDHTLFKPPPLDVDTLPAAPHICPVRTQNGISQNVARDLIAQSKHPGQKIGVVVAGNSGLPGGATSAIGKWVLDVEKVHPFHKSQEESVVANWIRHQIEPLREHEPHKKAHEKMRELFTATICNEWGLPSTDKSDYMTKQGIDYVRTKNAADYYDCWVVRNAKIGLELRGSDRRKYAYTTTDLAAPKKIGALFFACAPNGNCYNSDGGSTARTLNALASKNYHFFQAGLKITIMAVIDAAIKEQMQGKPLKVLIFNAIGGGLYWPKKARGAGEEPPPNFYKTVMNDILQTACDSSIGPIARGRFFDAIYLVL